MPQRSCFQIVNHANQVVTDPTRFANKPALRLLAWAVLMGERGKHVNQFNLAAMQRGKSPTRSHAVEIADARFEAKISAAAAQ